MLASVAGGAGVCFFGCMHRAWFFLLVSPALCGILQAEYVEKLEVDFAGADLLAKGA